MMPKLSRLNHKDERMGDQTMENILMPQSLKQSRDVDLIGFVIAC